MCEKDDTIPQPERPTQSVCIKCKTEKAKVFIRQSFCRNCFEEYVIHRFRSSLGKAKAIQKGDKVMICFSGGPSSSALVHIVSEVLKIETFKQRLGIEVIVGHISEDVLFPTENALERIKSFVSKYEFPFDYLPLEDVFQSNHSETDDSNYILLDSKEEEDPMKFFNQVKVKHSKNPFGTPKETLLKVFSQIKTITAKEDLLSQLRNQLLISLARKHNCTKVFYGENSTRLAIKVISLTSKGRGYTLPLETCLMDNRFPDLKLLRPLKDILSKEIGIFNYYKNIEPIIIPTFTTKAVNPKTSIDHLTEVFVTGLQKDFPSTVGAITKTSEKFSFDQTKLNPTDYCPLCQFPKQLSIDHWKRSVVFLPNSKGAQKLENQEEVKSGCQNCSCNGKEKKEDSCEKEFDIYSLLCYSCQISIRDTKQIILPPYVAQSSISASNRENLKSQIQDFLIEDE